MRIREIVVGLAMAACIVAAVAAQAPVVGVADPEALFTSPDPRLNANKQVVLHIIRDLLEANRWDQAPLYLTREYIQHNPNVASGLEPVMKYFGSRTPGPIPARNAWKTKVVSVTAEGDLVVVALVREYRDPRDASKTYTSTWFDMWRMKDGKADEHWDGALIPAPPPPAPAAPQAAVPPPPGVRPAAVTAIPGVVAAGTPWKLVWQSAGNNADGIVGTADGGLLVAQNDLSQVVKIDRDDRASVYLRDTRTGGSLSIDAQGRLFAVQRMVPMAVATLAPDRKVIADTYMGKPVGDLGRLNDLVVDRKGGAYFTVGGAFYAAPDGKITSLGDNIRANGIILSRDDKTLYVTNREVILAFDVLPDGMVANRRDFAKLEGGGTGDGMAIDAEGRVYVTSLPGVQVLSPDGKYLGLIPTPRNAISAAFSGADKKMLYVVGIGATDADGKEMTAQAASIYKISTLAQGFPGRAK